MGDVGSDPYATQGRGHCIMCKFFGELISNLTVEEKKRNLKKAHLSSWWEEENRH